MGFLNMFVHPRGLKDLAANELASLQASGVFLVDVRTPREFQQGHIQGAVSAPLGTTTQAVDDWPRDRKIVLICQSGHRSQAAAHDLLRLGFADVSHLKGGMAAWSRAGGARVR